jgi:two-component system chemotaxis response regulator CheY
MSLKALVVDDSRLARSILARAVQQCGCEVVGLASNGVEAIDLYKKLKPDLVTMDLKMPDMDGLTAMKAIRLHARDAVVIVVSSLSKKEDVLECVKAGASNYILKPFDVETVKTAIVKCFPDLASSEALLK